MFLNLILIIILNKYIKSVIVLPIYTLPIENYKNSNANKTIQEHTFNSLYKSSFYTIIQIGQPLQTIPLLIKQEPNLLIITSINSIKNCKSYQYIDTFNFSETFLASNNFSFYNENNSDSFILNKCNFGQFYEAEEVCNCNETFLFYRDFCLCEKIKKEKLSFNLVRNSEDNITGEIGLNLYDTNKGSFNSFLNILKRNDLINNYNWYFDVNNKTNETKLILGGLPHEIQSFNYYEDDLMYCKVESSNYLIYWKIRFNKIFALNDDLLASLKYFDDTVIEFKFDINIIIGTDQYSNYLFKILEEYFIDKKCFIEIIIDYQNNSNKLKFIYCKNEKYIYGELYYLVPTIFFYSNDFNYTFEINSKDLLEKKDDYIYLKIAFSVKGNNVWKLGKLFSLKYKFVFNPETKQVGFYLRESSQNISKEKRIENLDKIKYSNNFIFLKILAIITLIILLSFLGIKYYKILCNFKRQKRKNEITLINEYKYDSNSKEKEMTSLNNNND